MGVELCPVVGQAVVDIAPPVTDPADGTSPDAGTGGHVDNAQVAPGSPRFELLETIGAGGQGTTWRAFDHDSGKDVAVKAFDLGRMDDWKDFDLFERECAVLASLDHPGIPKFIASWADPEAGQYFLAMDLVHGDSLEQRLSAGGTTDDVTANAILRASLEILDHLHAQNPPVIHRDIKPANLLLGTDGTVSLVDFGGVRVALKPDGGSTVVGTFGYMAPEQLHGQATAVTDIYSLGVTLLALLTGLPGESLPRRGLKIDVEKVMTPSPLRDTLSAMVSPDPDLRPVDARTVIGMLDAAANNGPAANADPLESLWSEASESSSEAVVDPEVTHPSARSPGPVSLLIWGASTLAKLVLAATVFGLLPLLFWIGFRRRQVRNNPKKRAKLERRKRRLETRLDAARKRVDRLARRHDPDGQHRDYRRERGGPGKGGRGGRGRGRKG